MWMMLALGTGCSLLFPTPEQRVCTKMVDACDLQPTEDHDPYASCVQDLKPWLDDAPEDNVEALLTCVESARGCGKVQGCLAGAGLRSVMGELKGLIDGFGEALGLPKKQERPSP